MLFRSTLMNALVGEKLSIVSHKASTTRNRIYGILSGEKYQLVYSDTPGLIKPAYELQKSMMHFVENALEDADLALVLADARDNAEENNLLFEQTKECHQRKTSMCASELCCVRLFYK